MDTESKVTLKIATPAGVYEDAFEENLSVQEVIRIVVKAKGLAESDTFELALNGDTLDPDTKLASLHLEDGTVLDLIASGSAV